MPGKSDFSIGLTTKRRYGQSPYADPKLRSRGLAEFVQTAAEFLAQITQQLAEIRPNLTVAVVVLAEEVDKLAQGNDRTSEDVNKSVQLYTWLGKLTELCNHIENAVTEPPLAPQIKQMNGFAMKKIDETQRAYNVILRHFDDVTSILRQMNGIKKIVERVELKQRKPSTQLSWQHQQQAGDVEKYKAQLPSLEGKFQQQHVFLTVEARTFRTAVEDLVAIMQQLISSSGQQPDTRGWLRRFIGI